MYFSKDQMQTLNNESFYSFFQNVTQINGYKGFVGYGIRELNSSEFDFYCLRNHSLTYIKSFPLIQVQINFTSDFFIRTYTSGCYYYDTDSGKWFPDGMSLLNETNIQQTHCSSSHLTSFAGGLLLMPNKINEQYSFSNASPTKNYTIYLTLIVICILYILFGLWSIIMDKRDLKKLNISLLKDNNVVDSYFYEITAFTGDHKEAGTNSIVIFYNYSIKSNSIKNFKFK
jgi:hypothetical protein